MQRPRLVCGAGQLRAALEADVALLREPYWPTPWCVEARLQTVLGSLLRSHCLPRLAFRREVLRLSDGGQVALDWLGRGGEARAPDRPVLLVLPGLTGGPHADYVRCLCAAAEALRADAVVFSNRGLGGLPLTTPRLYSAVSDEDLAEVVAHVERAHGGPLLAAGVSLGGLILARYLARRGPAARLQAALVVSSPLDVEAGAACIERPPLNALLSWHMARSLRRTVAAHGALRGAGVACDWPGVAASRSVRQFDAAFTARHFGFDSVDAYYRAATLRGKLHRVRAPLLCLCAADDPFQPEHGESLPPSPPLGPPSERLRQPRPVAVLADVAREVEEGDGRVALWVTARGGHIGFLEGWWPARDAPSQYLARLTHQYFAALLARPQLLHWPSAPPPAS